MRNSHFFDNINFDKEERFYERRKENGKIILEPICQVPVPDKDPKALTTLLKGIKDVKESKLYDLGSFAKYAKEQQD